MKIGVIGDIHWSKYSSIVRSRGNKYSTRLENCINSVNWAENLTSTCDQIVYLGDFFDSSELNAEEISALDEILWNDLPHTFLVGNHEMGLNNLTYSSTHAFNLNENMKVIDKPTTFYYAENNMSIIYIPYILEDSRNDLNYYIYNGYIKQNVNSSKKIIFSHNDIAGIQLGKFKSENGFTLDEILKNSDLFLNGHLHNGAKIQDGIINVGNLTGQNFSEDAERYDHTVIILDTDTLICDVYENPYAMNFYKIDMSSDTINKKIILDKKNAVVSLKVGNPEMAQTMKNQMDNDPNIITSRITISSEFKNNEIDDTLLKSLSVNHIDKFKDYILQTLGDEDIVLEELQEVVNG